MAYQGYYEASKDQIKVIFGQGSLVHLPAEIQVHGPRAFLITSNTVHKTGLFEKVSMLLGSNLVGVFHETKPHSPRGSIVQAAELARAVHPNCLINLGGGSTTDTAKGVKLALWMGICDEEGFDKAHKRLQDPAGITGTDRSIPHISLPTTLVGAEFTPGMGITNETIQTKQTFSHLQLRTHTVILDPQLTVYTPSDLWLSTGVKALEHAIAKLSGTERHPVVDATASLAVQILGRELLASSAHSEDMTSRGQLQVGAWLAMFGGRAIPGMRMGLSHAIGRQCGGISGAPHGLISSVILPFTMDYNALACGEGMVIVARALGVNTEDVTAEDIGSRAAEAMRMLIARLGLPTRLRDIGVSREVLPLIAKRTMSDMSIGMNPRHIADASEVLTLLERAW